MERSHKSWGEKWNVFQNDLCEVSILYLQPWQRCSWHRHQAKFNQFFVIEGLLFVKTDTGIATVKKHEIFTTRPGEYHEFQTHATGAVIQEIMYVKYDSNDIERETIGGPLNEAVL
jgi:mannose-6-phosphate isomerase-like protein (cupin superfamily)